MLLCRFNIQLLKSGEAMGSPAAPLPTALILNGISDELKFKGCMSQTLLA